MSADFKGRQTMFYRSIQGLIKIERRIQPLRTQNEANYEEEIMVLQNKGDELMIGKTLLGPQSASVHELGSVWQLMSWY